MGKILSFIFLVFMMISPGNARGNDHEQTHYADHEALIGEYIKNENQYARDGEVEMIQVIISDLQGNVIRQVEWKGNRLEMNPSKILRPAIDKAIFLTEIGGIYYYLYPEISEKEKK
jgi:hypothetical protein